MSEETPYDELRECFPVLKECYWNGSMKSETTCLEAIVIGGSDKETRVPEGWRHIYLDLRYGSNA